MNKSTKLSTILYFLVIIGFTSFTHVASAVTGSFFVTANNDDAEEGVSDGNMYRGSSDLELGYDGNREQIVGMRFSLVDIPQGAVINSAYIEFTTDETDSGTTNLVIFGEAENNPNQFANNDYNISSRNKTAASVNWSPSAWNSVNELHQSADISSIIQEIVNRPGWVANNSLVLIIEPGAGCSSSACQRTAESHNGAPGSAPLLVVDYSEGNFSGRLNVDNQFWAYLSTDDAVQGTFIGSGNVWQTTYDISANLTPGQTYYLHLYAEDTGGPAGFLGDFELTGTDHVFANGQTTLTTNTADWRVSRTGWNNYQTPTSYGTNGAITWGTRPGVDANATWIWSGDNNSHNVNYFSTTINAAIPLEIAAVSGSCASLTEVTVTFNEDVEQISAEAVTNYQVLSPSGNSLAVNSAVRSASNSVTLSLATMLNDLTSYRLVVNNVQSTVGGTIAANSTDNFSLSCNINCISETFPGPGGLSSSWSASSRSGSFGIPRVVENGRLRLTNASGNVATVATLLNQFPGADNKIEVEFDLYAYGGSGADGIVVTFSDADIPPVPGSYGGALGYAQRSGGGAGFAGGWLGVGIDEYGNFANPNEGKNGGSGFERDSVALRGSGSGTTGYPYLTSTGTLSPGIDQSGSTPNPGHRYKITVDHTMGGGQAFVTVERDTGSGYIAVIPRFDIYATNPSQAAVPENWVVSFTGSTGGATNIHEVGDLQVCAAQPISAYGSPDHYAISHSSPGITCEGSVITVTAHDASHNEFIVPSNINLNVTTSPAVTAIVTSPLTILAGDSSANFYIQQSTALSNIDIDVTDGVASDLDGDTGGEDPRLSFSDTAFRFYANGAANSISTQVAGGNTAGQNLTLKAIKTDDETGACVPALQGPTPTNVDIAYECNNPTSCSSTGLLEFKGEVLTGDNQGNGPSYASVPMVFDGNGEAEVNFSFADAGQITLRARKSVAANDPDPAFTLNGTSNAFWVRPSELQLSAQSAGSDIDGNSANSGIKHKAGDPFNLVVRAVNASGDITPNYRPGQLQLKLARTGPLVGSEGVLRYSSLAAGTLVSASVGSAGFENVTLESFVGGSLGNGISQFLDASYSEVGLINLAIQDINYGNGGLPDLIQGTAIDIGRFYPDHFDLSLTSASFGNSCNSFTYLDQDFFFDNAPQLTIEAKNAAGDLTQNYTGNFWKLGASLLEQGTCSGILGTKGFCYTDNLSAAASFSGPNSSQSYGDVSTVNGQKVMLLHNQSFDAFTYSRPLAASELPFDADVGLQIELEDSDGVTGSIALSNIGFSSDSNTAAVGFNTTNDELLRHGRWKMENAYGPETQNLKIQAHAQYYTLNNRFEFNADDSCTALNSSDITLNGAASSDPVTIGLGSSNFSFNSPLALEETENFSLSLPGAGNAGDVDIDVDLSNYPWLQFDWNQDGSLIDHPTIKASFGQYRGHDRIIYWHEISN
jgi:MSHA biogenesis protein MshQ